MDIDEDGPIQLFGNFLSSIEHAASFDLTEDSAVTIVSEM